MAFPENHYQVLGVLPTAPREELRAAWLRVVKQTHPDRNPGDREAERRCKQANAAWQVLQDPATRAAYDQELARQAARPAPPPAPPPSAPTPPPRPPSGRFRHRRHQEAPPPPPPPRSSWSPPPPPPPPPRSGWPPPPSWDVPPWTPPRPAWTPPPFAPAPLAPRFEPFRPMTPTGGQVRLERQYGRFGVWKRNGMRVTWDED